MAVFTMYNPATWVMAINVSMSLIAVTGLFLFGYQLYRASIQSTADFICSRVKNLAHDHATNPSSIQAHVGWFGFLFYKMAMVHMPIYQTKRPDAYNELRNNTNKH